MPQKSKKTPITFSIPKLDAFDVLAISLWVGILLPAVQLPSTATFVFLRSIFFVLWTTVLFIYVAAKIFLEKKMVFYSATWANRIVAMVGGSFLLSFILSASRIDSLFGYDLSFTSSSLILIALVILYFTLKLAGLSLEYAVSRVFSVLPFTLVVLDLVSVVAFLLPTGVYTKILGSYAQYFSFVTNSPLGILGGSQQILFIHLIALVIALWQFASVYRKGIAMTVDTYRKAITAGLIIIATSYLVFFTLALSTATLVVSGAVVVSLAALVLSNKHPHIKQFGAFLAISAAIVTVLGLVWWKVGIVGDSKAFMISSQATGSVVQQSFLNSATPMWRQLVGFGVGTFPYLYMQYRPLESARVYGNDTFFFKPSSMPAELFIEHGILGVIAFLALLAAIYNAYKKASSKASLVPELSVIVISIATFLISPSSLVSLVVFFVALAAYFDKVEALPETLPQVRAIDLKETTFTNKSVNRSGVLLLGLALIYLVYSVVVLIAPTITMFGYAKAVQRYAVARQQVSEKDTNALKTYSDAYAIASNYGRKCKDCAQLQYLSLSTLVATSDLYSGLTQEQRNASQELRQIRNMISQSITDLLGRNSVRYDYWLTVSQAYRSIAEDEKSSSLYTLAVQAIRNSLSVNQYSIDANYLYIDILLRLGNDSQINTEINNKLTTLKQLVGTPYQIQFIEGIMLARVEKYDDSVKAFEKIKTEATDSTLLSAEDKKSIVNLADQRITEVKKIKETPKTTPSVTPTPTVTPTATQTPAVTNPR